MNPLVAVAVSALAFLSPIEDDKAAQLDIRAAAEVTARAERIRPPAYTHPDPDVERWHTVAIAAGWSEADWPVLACIMLDPWGFGTGESHGDPTATNLRGVDRSFGLVQLNTKGMMRWYRTQGVDDPYQLHDPLLNLTVAKALSDDAVGWADDRWRPWRSTSTRAKCFGLVGATS